MSREARQDKAQRQFRAETPRIPVVVDCRVNRTSVFFDGWRSIHIQLSF